MERVRGEAQVYGQASLHAPNIKNETAILLPAESTTARGGQEDVLRQRDGGAMGRGERRAEGGKRAHRGAGKGLKVSRMYFADRAGSTPGA